GIGPRACRIAALVDIAPYEPRRTLGKAVHHRQVISEIRHARILDIVPDPPDVELRKMMVGQLLHGHHSAACGTGSRTPWLVAFREYSSIRTPSLERTWRETRAQEPDA